MAGLNFYRRDTFLGRTDQYLTSALSGYAVFDPLRDYFAVHHRDDTVTRLKRYHQHWRFYNRKHYTLPQHDGDNKLVINYARAIVNKSCDWLMSKPFTFKAAEGNELLAKLLLRIWQDNNYCTLAWRAAMIGGVTGDAYLFVTVPWFDDYGRPVPYDQQGIKIQALNAAYVHPKFSSSEDRTVIDCLIQYPIDSRKFRGIVDSPQSRDLAVYSQYINATEIREFINEKEMPNSPRPNLLGFVPLVHIQNLMHPGFFGLSDLDDIIPLNEEYNEVSESIRKIIKYHAEPTTLIFGAKMGDLVKGANKVWSNLPTDARVENLGLDANLTEAVNYREQIKLAIHELSNTPEQSLGKIQPISNTSNAALETAYLPLIEKTMRKRITYGEGIQRANQIILMYLQNYFQIDLADYASDVPSAHRTEIVFPSPLPSDEGEIVQSEIQKLQASLQSESGAIERIYGGRNTTRAIEITADKREKMLRDSQAMVSADSGGLPNLAVHSVGSLGMVEGVAEAFEEQDRLLDEAAKELAAHEVRKTALEAENPEEPPEETQ